MSTLNNNTSQEHRHLSDKNNPYKFSTFDSTAIANIGANVLHNPIQNNPNALCTTSGTGIRNVNSLCFQAFAENQSETSVCGFGSGTLGHLVSADDTRVPKNGIRECKNSQPGEVCVQEGAVAMLCSPDQMGLNVGGGNYQMNPSYIAVPKSTADWLNGHNVGCNKPNPHVAASKYGYMKTSHM